jgi:glutaminyl-peptide cyclotransferase
MKTTELTRGPGGRVNPSGGSRRAWIAAIGSAGMLALGAGGWVVWSQAGTGMSQSQIELKPAPIDGNRAFGYLKQICALGPRTAGSEANAKQREMVAAHFKAQGATITEQPFAARDPLSGRRLEMVNLIGSWFPERTRRVLICAHYDTRPYPDQEPDPRLRNAPFLGANDCASGVALLMEMANHLKDSPTEWGVDLVILDGEELVYDRVGEYFLGSKEFARRYRTERRSGKRESVYAAGILLDMVGGKDLALPKEPYSLRFAGGLVRDVWGVAEALKADAFLDGVGREVLDDHLALNDAGIPTIDIIDFDYPHWHTASDTPEHCDPASLAQVGRVVTAWLSKPMPKRRQ